MWRWILCQFTFWTAQLWCCLKNVTVLNGAWLESSHNRAARIGGTWSGVNYRCVHKEMGLVGFLLGVFTQSYLSNF